MQDGERVAQLRFHELSDGVIELLDKLIFRHHRRLIAGARLSAHYAPFEQKLCTNFCGIALHALRVFANCFSRSSIS